MTPLQRAFLSTVLRYVALVHGRGDRDGELASLRALLESPQGQRDDRRRWRRLALALPATTRNTDLQAPAQIVDVGAGGMRLDNLGHLRLRPGDRVVVSLLPPPSAVRIDVPCEVVRAGPGSELGVRFCGRPLTLHRTLQPPLATRRPGGTARMGAVDDAA
ncbi:MAG: PilZ domain-containing protein [Nannocystaceae bacterium]|nr:PilZ domain-containing protein [Nannocystaceae bacterium]